MKHIHSTDELKSLINSEVALSDWIVISQERINAFANATEDHQWIHVDPVKAAQGPFGHPIAHGFLTLSLIPHLFSTAMALPETGMAINYGLNKVRFTSTVAVNTPIRGRFFLLSVEPLMDESAAREIGYQMNWRVSIEQEGQLKPVCVAESITRRYF